MLWGFHWLKTQYESVVQSVAKNGHNYYKVHLWKYVIIEVLILQ